MLEKFQKKIVYINVIFIGALLASVCFISFNFSKNSLMASHQNSFRSQCIIFEEQLSSTNTLSFVTVQDFKNQNGIEVYLLDNGQLINMTYGKPDQNYLDLFDNIQSQYELIHSTTDKIENEWDEYNESFDFQITSSNQNYFARQVIINTANNGNIELAFAQSMVRYESLLLEILFMYIGIAILSFIFIFILNYYFAKKAIAPAIKAQQSQIEFITAASHELKTPIAVIQSSTEMLSIDKSHYDNYIANITSETQRMKRLVEDLLLLSGMESNHAQFELKLIDSEELLLSIYEKFIPISHKSKHNLQLHLQEKELSKIYVDSDKMIQALVILLDNALSYTPEGTGIEILGNEKDSHLIISIVDHGSGIIEKDKVFDRFYRGDQSRSSKNHFGLGLSIANEIILNFMGSLTIIDTPGGGATFRIKLPTNIS